jgi:regulation of enolase protein 1 (concanavalin A-like superfamily)
MRRSLNPNAARGLIVSYGSRAHCLAEEKQLMQAFPSLLWKKRAYVRHGRTALGRGPTHLRVWACLMALAGTYLTASVPAAHGQAGTKGQWHTLQTQMPINPIHVALMHNGKILVVSGSGNFPQNTNFGAAVWDPATNTVAVQSVAWDMFCSSMSALPDGRILVVGGNLQYDPFHGWQRTAIFDPATGKLVDMQDMAHGRWYPTTTELGDGRTLTFSGLDENGNTNSQVEIYKAGVGWGSPLTAQWTPPLYPRLHLIPNGKLFYSGSTTQSRYFDPSTNAWSSVVATTKYGGTRTYGTSVLLPLTPANAYKPRVMIFGGDSPSTATTEIIDLSAGTPAWTNGPAMSQPRIEMTGTILPNGKVILMGGSLNDEDTTTASLNADLFDSNTNSMAAAGAGANAFARLYHSVSLLLPDGTVWLAGGNPVRGTYETNVEIYSPAYLFNSDGTAATRPTITGVTPGVFGYGAAFQVQTPDAANIASVVLMKNGASTHAFDMDQRMVGLSFTAGNGVLNVTGPPNGNIAPPGYYMLFLLNSAGVPSVAKFVQISTAPGDVPPTGTITSPASNLVIAPGASVNFAGTGTAPSGSIAGYSWVYRGGTPGLSSLQNPGNVTFSTPGTYVASLTVTDNAGITDPSPQTRTITVTTAPAPALSAANPNSGTQGSSNLGVTLTGSHFLNGASCNFGSDISVNSCTFVSATQIQANVTIPGTAVVGSRNVTVTNPDGQSSTLTNGFAVKGGAGNPAPTLTNASPSSGTQGQSNITVTLTGSNFLIGVSCDFGSAQGITTNSCTYNSPTQITASLSIAANAVLGGHDIVITDTDGQSATLAAGFVVQSSTTTLTHIDFTYGDRTSLLSGGWSFVAKAAAGTARNTEIVPGPPSADYNQTTHPGTIRIQLGSGEIYGTSNNSQNTLFRSLPTNWTSIRLKVASFNPTSNYQQVGLLLYQDDDNYLSLDRVYANAPSIEAFTEVGASVTYVNRLSLTNTGNLILQISQTSPGNYVNSFSTDSGTTWTTIGSASITLTGAKLGIQTATDHTGTFPTADYAWVEIQTPGPLPAPSVTGASPNSAFQGQNNVNITLTGANFQSGPACNLGAGITVNSCTYNSPAGITANVSVAAEASIGARDITITNSDGQSGTLASGFNVQQNPAPTLSGASPSSGSQGQNNLAITLTGSHFLAGALCNFGTGVSVNSCAINSSAQIIANISIAATAPVGSNNVTVTNFDGQFATVVGGFAITAQAVNPAPILSGANPNSAIQGQSSVTVLLSGSNFLTGPGCTFGTGISVNSCTYNSATQVTANISIAANAPIGASSITVTNSDGQAATLANGFTVNQNTTGSTQYAFNYANRSALLADGWSFVATTAAGGSRNTEVTSGSPSVDYNQTTHPGAIRIQLGNGEMYAGSNNSQNTLFHSLPPNWTSIRLKLAAFNPTANYQQVGLILYQDDDNYLDLDRNFVNGTSIETFTEKGASVSYVNRLPLTNTGNLIMRIDQTSPNNYATYYSVDNATTWTQIGSTTVTLSNAKLAIEPSTDLTGTFPTVDLAWVQILTPGILPPPSVLSVSPNSGTQGQNLNVVIAGNNFVSGPTCNFGAGITVNSCAYNSAGQITANISIAPTAASGPNNVTITNSDGQVGTLTASFSIQKAVANPAPTLTGVSPSSGTQTQTSLSVTLTGTNFQAGPTCTFGSGITVNSCTFNSTTQITANVTIAANAPVGTSNVSITDTDGQTATLANGFTVTATTGTITHVDFNYPDRASLLSGGWSLTATTAQGAPRNTEVTPGPPSLDYNQTVHPGDIRIQLGSGEIYGTSNNSQNTLFRGLPANWKSIRLKVAAFNPTANYQQVGLLLYQDDDNYINIDRGFVNGPELEMFTEKATSVSYVNRVSLTNTGNLIIRLDQPTANNFSSFYSTDGGNTWVQIGTATFVMSNPRLGIQPSTDLTKTFPTVDLAWVEIWQ